MKEQISKEELVQMLQAIAGDMIKAKEYLGDLDAAIGDGDLGVTMTLGFRVIQKELVEAKELSLTEILRNCGVAFADHAASTFGTLMATMFMRAGRVVKEKDLIGTSEGAEILKAAAEGVQKRGKAELGDKTVLDALIPASEAFENSFADGNSFAQCLNSALMAAREGAERTIDMRSRIGRSGWLGERTVGHKDPGAAAFVLLLESASNSLESKNLA